MLWKEKGLMRLFKIGSYQNTASRRPKLEAQRKAKDGGGGGSRIRCPVSYFL